MMAVARAFVAATALGLGAATPRGVRSLEQEDASAFVQLSVESLEGGGGGGPLWKRRRNRTMDFGLQAEEHGHFAHYVGSASFNVDVMGWHVHCYDIAMYLNENSSLWNVSHGLSREERMDEMLGNSFFELIAHSKWVNNQNMAKFVDRLDFFAEKAHISSYKEPIQAYKQLYLKGPKVDRGSHILLFPSREGIRPVIEGRDMGLVKSDFIGRIIMQAYLGPDSDLPEFRDHIFSQLTFGKPDEVGQPAEVHQQAGDSISGAIIVAVVVVVAVCCFCGCLWYLCRRKSEAPTK